MPGFVGRDRELGRIAELLADVEHGARIIAVTGDSGVGKTALLRTLAAAHPSRWAQAAEWETDMIGGVLAQLLRTGGPADPAEAAQFLFDRLEAVGPQLLIVDDAQDADVPSLQALSTMSRHHREATVLVVLGVSSIEDLPVRVASTEIRLAGLPAQAVAELAHQQDVSLHPTMVDALARHTGGNPRNILALLRQLPPAAWARPDTVLPAPTHVVDAVRAALSQCGRDARSLVEALAVLGENASLLDVATLAGLDDPLGAIDGATTAGLLSQTASFDPTLRGPMTAAAVIELMGARAAADAHRRAAELVADPAQRLRHRVAAAPVPDESLADDLDALAREHGANGAWAQAAALFRDAGRLTPDPLVRDERLTRAVDALVAAGDCGAAAAMVPAVESLRETPLRNAVLAYLAILRGRCTEAEVRLSRAWEIVNPERFPDTAALIAQRYVLHSLVRCQGSELVGWAEAALGLAARDSPSGIEAAAIRGLGLLAAGYPKRASAAYDDLAARVRHGAQAQRVTMGRGWVQLIRDDIDGARSSLESAVATANLGGSTRITLWSLGWLARVQFVSGEWDQALRSVETGRALAAASDIVLVTPLLEWTAAQVHALRGNWDAAEAAVQSADKVTQDYEIMKIPTLLARAQIAEAAADYPKVHRCMQPLIRMAPGTSLTEPGYWPWPDVLANALVVDGRLEEADAFLRPHEDRARARKHRSALARLGYARGRLLGAQGELRSARDKFEDSLAQLDGLPLRYDLARVNFAYGQTLRRAGKRRDADAIINTARDLYLSLGAHTYVARCDRELKAGGLHTARGSRDSIVLTPQEEAVTTLVTQGLSNREVAAELYVSPKTVQYHLTRVYAKLGVRSRAELAALRR